VNKIKVLIADDHFLARRGLYGILDDEADMECVSVAEDGKEAVALAQKHRPDVAIIDVAMPNMNGIEATREIKKACPDTAVIVISGYKYDHYILSCIEAGAEGYLLKENVLGESLLSAIRMVYAGESVYDREVSKIMGKLVAERGKTGIGSTELGDRELQVLKLATQGMSNKEIGAKLCISDQTVATHFVNIFRKLAASKIV
jgi:DNA-binding NarL/FixJ family response regulator